MTSPAQTQQEKQEKQDQQTAKAVLAVLAVGAPPAATAASLAKILGVHAGLVKDFLGAIGRAAFMTFKQSEKLTKRTPSSAGQLVRQANLRYRASFLMHALRRIAAAPDKKLARERELRFWKAHKDACARRLQMAYRVDIARERHGDLLGWYAVGDSRTSAECRAAGGRNFHALKPPVIGYPGSVHPHCRCLPGPPHKGGKMVGDSLTVQRHGNALN